MNSVRGRRLKLWAIAFLILGVIAISGCSDDPYVAPWKLFIIDKDISTVNKVFYDPNTQSRVMVLDVGTTAELRVISNRTTIPEYSWHSDNTSVATVEDGLIEAVFYGSCRIEARSKKVSAYCYVVVPDENAPGTIYVSSVGGGISPTNGSYVVYAPTIESLNGESYTMSWTSDNDAIIESKAWYINGIYAYTGDEFTPNIPTFGSYTITCIVLGKGGQIGYHTLNFTAHEL